MEIRTTVTGAAERARALRALGVDLGRVETGPEAEALAAELRRRTPVDTGELKESTTVDKGRPGRRSEVRIAAAHVRPVLARRNYKAAAIRSARPGMVRSLRRRVARAVSRRN